MNLTVPANASATLRLHVANAAQVTEGGRPLSQAAGVHVVAGNSGDTILQVAAGTYQFQTR